jgi:hypothetical protein
VPVGVRVEGGGNRVRIDPEPFGLQADLFAALEGDTARVPGDPNRAAGPAERAREQIREVLAIDVPTGFVQVAHEYVGLEEFGDVGHVHLVLADRWPADAPCL